MSRKKLSRLPSGDRLVAYIQPRPLRGGVFGFGRFGSPRISAAMPTPVDGFQVMVSSLRGRLTPIRCEATQAQVLAFSANHHPM